MAKEGIMSFNSLIQIFDNTDEVDSFLKNMNNSFISISIDALRVYLLVGPSKILMGVHQYL